MNIIRSLFETVVSFTKSVIIFNKTFVDIFYSFFTTLISLVTAGGPLFDALAALINTLFQVFGTFFNAVISIIVSTVGSVVNALGPFITFITAGLVNVPSVNTQQVQFKPIDFGALGAAITNIIAGIINLLNVITEGIKLISNFLNWCMDNVEIVAYLGLLALVGIATLFPVTAAIIYKLPFAVLVGLFVAYFFPVGLYIYLIYVAGLTSKSALESTKEFVFNIVPFCIQNLDVVIYISLIVFEIVLLQNLGLYEFLRELLSRILLLDLLFLVVVPTAIPFGVFLYYYFIEKVSNVFDAIQKTRQNLSRVLSRNFDVIVYGLVVFTTYLALTDQGFMTAIRGLLPEFLFFDLQILLVGLVISPLLLFAYYILFERKQVLDALSSTRLVFYSLNQSISGLWNSFINKLFKSSVTPPAATTTGTTTTGTSTDTPTAPTSGGSPTPVAANAVTLISLDPNPGLGAYERMFFAQLFGDNLGVSPYNNTRTHPFYAGLASVTSPVSTNTAYGLYDLLYYEDLNAEFYGDPNFQRSLYGTKYSGKRMTRSQYIAIPYNSLKGNNIIQSTIDATIFQCLNIVPGASSGINTLSDISDALLKSYATGYAQASLDSVEALLRASANNGYVLPIGTMLKNFLSTTYAYTTSAGTPTTIEYTYAFLQYFSLQTPANNIPGNLYALAFTATGATNVVQSYISSVMSSVQVKASNVQSATSAPITNIGVSTVGLTQNPIAFWNYAYAGIQGAANASLTADTASCNAYNDFNAALKLTLSGKISAYFLANDNYRDAWLGELYKLITGSYITSVNSGNYEMYEIVYKAFQGNTWTSLGTTYTSNLTNIFSTTLNAIPSGSTTPVVTQDAFTINMFNLIEAAITQSPTVATFNSTAYSAILNSTSGTAPYASSPRTSEPYFSELWYILDQSIRNDGNQGCILYNNGWTYSWILTNALPYIGWDTSATTYSSKVFIDALGRGYVHNLTGLTDSTFLWYPFNGGFWLYNVPRIDAQTIANQIKVNDFGNIDNFFTQCFNSFGQGSPTGVNLYVNMLTYLDINSLMSLVTIKVADVQNASSLLSTINTTNFTQAQATNTSRSSIAFWNYAYAAVQNSGNSALISATSSFNAYNDFITARNAVPSGKISEYFLNNDNYRDAWLGELYKLITGSSIDTNKFELYELVYKAFDGQTWSYGTGYFRSNLNDLGRDYLNGNQYLIQDAFTLAVFNAIEGVITQGNGKVAQFNFTEYNNILSWGGSSYKDGATTTEKYFSELWYILDLSIRNNGNQGSITATDWLYNYIVNNRLSYIGWDTSVPVFIDVLNRGYVNSMNGNTGSNYMWYPFNGGFWLYNVPRIDAQTIANQIKVNDFGNIDNFFTQAYKSFQGISPTGQDLYTRMMQYIEPNWNPITNYVKGVVDTITAYGTSVNNNNDLTWDRYMTSAQGNYLGQPSTAHKTNGGASQYHCTYSLLVNAINNGSYRISSGNIGSNLYFGNGRPNLNSMTIWQKVLDSTSLDGAFCAMLADSIGRTSGPGNFEANPYAYNFTSNADLPAVGTIMMFARLVTGRTDIGGTDNSWVWDQIIASMDSLYGAGQWGNTDGISSYMTDGTNNHTYIYGNVTLNNQNSIYAPLYLKTIYSPFAMPLTYQYNQDIYSYTIDSRGAPTGSRFIAKFPRWPYLGLYYNMLDGGTGTANQGMASSRTFFNAQAGSDPNNIYSLSNCQNNNGPWRTSSQYLGIGGYYFSGMIPYNRPDINHSPYNGTTYLQKSDGSAGLTLPTPVAGYCVNYLANPNFEILNWANTRLHPVTSFMNRQWFSNQFVRYLISPVSRAGWEAVSTPNFTTQRKYAIYANDVNYSNSIAAPGANDMQKSFNYPVWNNTYFGNMAIGDIGRARTLNDVGQNGNGSWGPSNLWGNYNIDNKYSLITPNTTLLDFYTTCYLHSFFYMCFNRNVPNDTSQSMNNTNTTNGLHASSPFRMNAWFKPVHGAGSFNGALYWPGYGHAANVDANGFANTYVINTTSPYSVRFCNDGNNAGYGYLLQLYAVAVKDLLNQCYNYYTGLTCNQGNSYSGYQNMVDFYTNLCNSLYNFSRPSYNSLQTTLNNYIYNTAWNNGIAGRNVILNLAGWGGGLATGVDYGNSNLYTTGGMTKLMQAVINTYNYTQGGSYNYGGTAGNFNAGSATPYALNQLSSSVYGAFITTGNSGNSTQQNWCCIAWTLAFRSNYALLLSLPTTMIGVSTTVSEKGSWQNTWPYRFSFYWNQTRNGTNNRSTLSIDYSAIFTTIFNNMKSAGALNYNNWIQNFYNLARTSASKTTGTQTQAALNQFMYQAAWNVLNSKSTTGTASGAKTNSTSGTNVGNFYLREDMPGEWMSVFINGSTTAYVNTMYDKCFNYYTSIINTVNGNGAYKGIFAQKFVDAISGNGLVNGVAVNNNTQQILKDYIYNTLWPNTTVGYNVLANLAGWGGTYGSKIYSTSGTTKLMSAVLAAYPAFSQTTLIGGTSATPKGIVQLSTGVYNGLITGSNNPNWCSVAWNLAFRSNYAQLLSLPTTFIGPSSGLSEKRYWGGTWPYRFASGWNATRNATNNRPALSIDYSAILTTVFNQMKSTTNALTYNPWIQNFYNLAKTSASQITSVSLSQDYLNGLMYQAAWNVLHNKSTAGAISGSKISGSGSYIPLREDMPGEWWSVFMQGNTENPSIMSNKCLEYFNIIVNTVAANTLYTSIWPQKYLDAMGTNIITRPVFNFETAYKTSFESALNNVGSISFGADATWLVNFYNLLNPGANYTTASKSQLGDILVYAFRALQALSPGNVAQWGSYIFQNTADQDAFTNQASVTCYNAASYGDPANSPWPSTVNQAKLWPNIVAAGIVLQPPTTAVSTNAAGLPVSVDITTQANGMTNYNMYVSYCNACYIQNSLAELRVELSTVKDAYAESVERFNIYAYKWGLAPNPLSPNATSVGVLTNPNFAMTLDQLRRYTYTFANGLKNIVMFNDFVSYSVLPAGYNSAVSDFGSTLDLAFGTEINRVANASSTASSSNLFAVADRSLQLIANGININLILGLYNNIRQANVNFLFNSMSQNGTIISTGASLSQSTLLANSDTNSTLPSSYNSTNLTGLSQLQGQAQVQSVLGSFTKSITLNNIQTAIQDAPGQNGIDATGKVKDYGSPYIRRLFYDAAAVLDSVYTDMFNVLTSNVFRKGTQYVPNPNDPLDMMWFRYSVQNWNNPFTGSKYGDGKYRPNTTGGDGNDSYLANGFYASPMAQALNAVISAYNNLIFTNPTTKYPGIYPRLISLLNYVTPYNNIINQAFNYTALGSTAIQAQQSLINTLSNKYLRLNQNNQYMDLMSLYAGTYQHFHINLPLTVSNYIINPQTQSSLQSSIQRMDISSVANLGQWLDRNLAQDPNYTKFKNEIAVTFIFKTLFDMVWWPQFCLDYFYNTGGVNTAKHRFMTTSAAVQNGTIDTTQMGHMISGRLQLSSSLIGQEIAQSRLNSAYLNGSNNANVNSFRQFDISNLVGYAANLIWQSMCYSYQHDAMFGYMFFSAPINALTGSYSGITTTNDKLMNIMNSSYNTYSANMADTANSTMLSSWNWLQNYTCFGGTTLPQQMVDAAAPSVSISAATNAKFAQSATKRAIMRQQFFADPMSWINTNRSYQIYPLVFANPSPTPTALAPTAAPWIYQASVTPQTFWPMTTTSSTTQYVNTFYQTSYLVDLQSLNTSYAYAPIIDTSMITTTTTTSTTTIISVPYAEFIAKTSLDAPVSTLLTAAQAFIATLTYVYNSGTPVNPDTNIVILAQSEFTLAGAPSGYLLSSGDGTIKIYLTYCEMLHLITTSSANATLPSSVTIPTRTITQGTVVDSFTTTTNSIYSCYQIYISGQTIVAYPYVITDSFTVQAALARSNVVDKYNQGMVYPFYVTYDMIGTAASSLISTFFNNQSKYKYTYQSLPVTVAASHTMLNNKQAGIQLAITPSNGTAFTIYVSYLQVVYWLLGNINSGNTGANLNVQAYTPGTAKAADQTTVQVLTPTQTGYSITINGAGNAININPISIVLNGTYSATVNYTQTTNNTVRSISINPDTGT